MSYGAFPQLIVHEVQKADSIHLSDKARGHIERLVHEARRKETAEITKDRDYWRDQYFWIINQQPNKSRKETSIESLIRTWFPVIFTNGTSLNRPMPKWRTGKRVEVYRRNDRSRRVRLRGFNR